MKKIKNRDEVFDFFEGYAQNSKEQIDSNKTRNPLLKTYVFETFNEDLSALHKKEAAINNILKSSDINLTHIDESLFLITRDSITVGFLEEINSRFSNLYTTIPASESDQLAKHILKSSSLIDSMWISGKLFDELLSQTVEYHYPHRFTKLRFEYDFIYDKKNYIDEIIEHKASSISFVEELENILHKINGVRDYLTLFHAISSMRLPSKSGAGGHDFYFNGKVTNRSTSFYDHRKQIIDTVNKYKNITEFVEKKAWISLEKTPSSIEDSFYTLKACPITIHFNEKIKPEVLEKFVYTVFPKGADPFKIIGEIKVVGKNRYHVYGTDMHLWQNLFIDISCTNMIVYLPYGTCGNTIHRLTTHIQKYIQPNIDVYIGDHSFNEIVSEAHNE